MEPERRARGLFADGGVNASPPAERRGTSGAFDRAMHGPNAFLNSFYDAITAPARSRLSEIHHDVVTNHAEKDELREIKKKLAELKAAVARGDHERAGELVAELRGLASEAGFEPGSPLMGLLESVDPAGLSARTEPFTREEERAWDDFFTQVGSVVDLEMADRSDLDSLQQIDFNSAHRELLRAEQTISDTLKAYNGAARTIVGNLKA